MMFHKLLRKEFYDHAWFSEDGGGAWFDSKHYQDWEAIAGTAYSLSDCDADLTDYSFRLEGEVCLMPRHVLDGSDYDDNYMVNVDEDKYADHDASVMAWEVKVGQYHV